MPNGIKFDDITRKADDAKKDAVKNEHAADVDKDKTTPAVVGNRLTRLEKLAGLR
jgi:hypothetical protein